jgi:hypothetical protein
VQSAPAKRNKSEHQLKDNFIKKMILFVAYFLYDKSIKNGVEYKKSTPPGAF